MEEKIRKQLKKVIDPELGVNIVDLGLIYKVDYRKGTAIILMSLTSPGCPLAFVFEDLITQSVGRLKGVEKVKIKLTFEPRWSPSKIDRKIRLKLGI